MENGDDSDDSSIEEMRRRCRHARKFIDGSLSNFLMKKTKRRRRRRRRRRRVMKIYHQEQEKSSGSINVSFGARIFECFNMKTCSRGLIECPFKPSTSSRDC
jgi:hypothetical protein